MTTVTLRDDHGNEYEMPGVTTAKYAAKRIADELGYDPDVPWTLAYWKKGHPEVIPDDRLVCDLENTTIRIGFRASDVGD